MAQRKCFENYIELQLKKLNRTQSYEMVQSLLVIDDLPNNVRNMILIKSEGNPFFIEEVIRSLMERGLVYKDGDTWTAKDGIEHIDVPDTIQGVIMERIDRLEIETKYVLQCASVIGRLFKYRLLDHLMSHERRLGAYLDELEGKELVLEERAIPELEYTFKHALTQDATYQTILEQRRRQFHRQVAEGIERLYQDRIEEFYEELAHHWELSGDDEKTLDYFIRAGEKAQRQYANEVAIEYYTKAINLAKAMGISGSRLAEIYWLRGYVYCLIGYYEEGMDDYIESANLYTDKLKRINVYQEISLTYSWCIGDVNETIKYMNMIKEMLDPDDKSREMCLSYGAVGSILFGRCNEIENSLELMQKAIDIAEEMNYIDILAGLYPILDWILNSYSAGDKRWASYRSEEIIEKRKYVRKKALDYLSYIDQNMLNPLPRVMVSYAGNYFILGAIMNDTEEALQLYNKALEIGTRWSDVWTIIETGYHLGKIYQSKDELNKAIENYEIACRLGIKLRFIWTPIENLIRLYSSKGQNTKLLDMMIEVLNSTKILHSKPKVYPEKLKRWNEITESVYEVLLSESPDVYHEFENAIKSYLNETSNISERFFYFGQLALLAVIDRKKHLAENYVHEMCKIKKKDDNCH